MFGMVLLVLAGIGIFALLAFPFLLLVQEEEDSVERSTGEAAGIAGADS
jgi:hypothetical protein